MTVGRWLDHALASAERAATVIGRDGIPVHDLLAAFYARDRAWMALARMADLIRGARAPKPLSLAAATGQLTDRTATPIRLIAAGAHAAVLRPRAAADVRLSASGPAARQIIDGADAVAVAADILATHIEPRTEHERALRLRATGDPAIQALARNRHLTMVGAGLAAGVDRDEAVGELARLAHAFVGVDQALAHGSSTALAYLGKSETEQLRRWTTGPFPALFAAHIDPPPAVLLRQIEPATAVERSTGPRPVDTYADVLRTVTDVSSAVKRDPQQLTARLLAAAARIGFGAEVLAGRIAGEDEPSPQTSARAMRWKNVAQVLACVRDAGDPVSPTYAQEANLAADWIRDRARRWPDTAAALPDSLEPLQQLLGGLAAQSIEPWRRALIDGRILTAGTDRLTDSHHKGIRHTQVTWSKAAPLDPQGRAVLHRLADAAAGAHPTWSGAARTQTQQLRSEEAIAGQGLYAYRLQARRKRLRLAVQAHNDAAHAQQAAAGTHARLQLLHSDRDYTEDRPRTAAQKAIRQQVDSLERELAHQQQHWEITRTSAQQLAQAADVPNGQNPSEVLQQLNDGWHAAIAAAVADDIEASANHDTAPQHQTPTAGTNTATEHDVPVVHIGADESARTRSRLPDRPARATNTAAERSPLRHDGAENSI